MQFPNSRLLVFCKAPVAGKVKTRLMNDLIQQGLDGKIIAAKIHEYLARHILALVTKARLAPVELWCAPDATHPFFQQCKDTFGVMLREQGEGDLGDRMSRAFKETLKNCSNAIIIGTDCPVYSVRLLQQAFEILQEPDTAVIASAEDGGYPLLGLQEPQEAIFRDMSWGSAKVFSETVNRLNGKVEILETLWDVDRLPDLVRLIKESRALGLDDDFIDYLDSLPLEIAEAGEYL
jgi:rSAM/selenodomain-associated transferase 1